MKENNISIFDKYTMFIAAIALFASLFSIYIQSFHESSDLGHIDSKTFNSFDEESQTLKITITDIFANQGNTTVANTSKFVFLTSKDTTYLGGCYSKNEEGNFVANKNRIYTDGCKDEIQLFKPGTISSVTNHLEISIENIEKLKGLKIQNDSVYNLHIKSSYYLLNNRGKSVNYITDDLLTYQVSFISDDSNYWKSNSIATYFYSPGGENLF